jgi:hypothetical protein
MVLVPDILEVGADGVAPGAGLLRPHGVRRCQHGRSVVTGGQRSRRRGGLRGGAAVRQQAGVQHRLVAIDGVERVDDITGVGDGVEVGSKTPGALLAGPEPHRTLVREVVGDAGRPVVVAGDAGAEMRAAGLQHQVAAIELEISGTAGVPGIPAHHVEAADQVEPRAVEAVIAAGLVGVLSHDPHETELDLPTIRHAADREWGRCCGSRCRSLGECGHWREAGSCQCDGP